MHLISKQQTYNFKLKNITKQYAAYFWCDLDVNWETFSMKSTNWVFLSSNGFINSLSVFFFSMSFDVTPLIQFLLR